jgi:hypothetical protein
VESKWLKLKLLIGKNAFMNSFIYKYPEEKNFLDCLKTLSEMIELDNKSWREHLGRLYGEAISLYTRKTSTVDERYKFVREVESLYGGMGSLNDGPFSEAVEEKIKGFYQLIRSLLRVYWKTLGKEWHAEPFWVIPVGSLVKLVIGKKRMYESDEKPVLVIDDENSKREWIVIENNDLDITNMPQYMLRSECCYCIARQESIEILRKAESSLDVLADVKKPQEKFKWGRLVLLLIGLIIYVLIMRWLHPY